MPSTTLTEAMKRKRTADRMKSLRTGVSEDANAAAWNEYVGGGLKNLKGPKGGMGPLGLLGLLAMIPWVGNETVDLVRKVAGTDPETMQIKNAERIRKMNLLAGALSMSEDAETRRRTEQAALTRDFAEAADRRSALNIMDAQRDVGWSGAQAGQLNQEAQAMQLARMLPPDEGQRTGRTWIDEGVL